MPSQHSNRFAFGRLGATKFGNVSAKTANHSVTNGESGTVFTTQGAGGAVHFTLPAVEAGLWYIFLAYENQDMYVVPPSVDTLVTFNDLAADNVAYATANMKVGGAFLVFCDGTEWIALALGNPGATITVNT